MNEGRVSYSVIFMFVSVYVSLLHDGARSGARTALAPCLETWLAPGDIVLTCYDMTATISVFTTFNVTCEASNCSQPTNLNWKLQRVAF